MEMKYSSELFICFYFHNNKRIKNGSSPRFFLPRI